MKALLTTLLLGVFALQSFAQGTELRAHAGLNYGRLSGSNNNVTFDEALGNSFGASLILGNQLYIMPGVDFSVFRSDVENNGVSGETRIRSIRAGVFGGVRLLDPAVSEQFNIRLFTGPIYAISTSSNQPSFEQLDDVEYDSNYLNWVFGAGIDIAFLFVEAGYDAGITQVNESTDFYDASRRSNLFLNAGIRLRL